MRIKPTLLLGLIICISIFFHFYKLNEVPPCVNADEAAFSYNAYSILKTAKDEYGRFMPLRFESFKDYKLPLYTYFSVPFIALFGLNDFSTRALSIFTGIAFVPLIFFITRELFNNNKIAFLAALFTSFAPGIFIMSRHAHEGVLCTLFLLLSVYTLIRFHKTKTVKYFLLTNLFLLASTFSYHTARLFLVLGITYQLFLLFRLKIKPNFLIVGTLIITLFFPFFIDAMWSVNRVKNLLFTKNQGFSLRINEYMGEHPVRLIHNKATEGIRDVTNRYFSQISPEFFVVKGDTNWRFGFQNLGVITPIEYLFIFVGLYYLFRNREKFRFMILGLILISPINNSLTWQDASLIRTYFILFPILLTAAYGLYHLYLSIPSRLKIVFLLIFLPIYGFYLYNNWDVYFNHYPKRAVVVRAWQCGYKEMTDYIEKKYDEFDQFVITDRAGQPYIFVLYNLRYDPAKYQKQAKISAPDKYGFGQIDTFDKFLFKFHFDPTRKKTAYIGYPDEFKDLPINMDKIQKIKVGTEELFWIYEVK